MSVCIGWLTVVFSEFFLNMFGVYTQAELLPACCRSLLGVTYSLDLTPVACHTLHTFLNHFPYLVITSCFCFV